jgi:hypothetical protein
LASGLPVSLSARMPELTWVRSWANSRTARMQIDKAAANRFISAAISSSRAAVDPNYTPASDDEDGSLAAATGPSGTHTRFTEAEKEDLDRLLEDHDVSDEDEDEDSDRDAEDSVVEEMLRGVRNGLAEAKKTRKDVEAATAGASSTGKKKRKAMDPFAGEQYFLLPILYYLFVLTRVWVQAMTNRNQPPPRLRNPLRLRMPQQQRPTPVRPRATANANEKMLVPSRRTLRQGQAAANS